MLPVVAGTRRPGGRSSLYSLVMLPVARAPALLGIAGVGSMASSAIGLGAVFVVLAGRGAGACATATAPCGPASALFAYSLLYLFAIFLR